MKTKLVSPVKQILDEPDPTEETRDLHSILQNLHNRDIERFLNVWGPERFHISDQCSFEQGVIQGVQIALSVIESTIPVLPRDSHMH